MKLRRTKEFYLREFGEMYTKPIENIFKEDGSDNYLYSQHEMFIEFFLHFLDYLLKRNYYLVLKLYQIPLDLILFREVIII